jgi:LuxR family maltose regulon positive regulatory protein
MHLVFATREDPHLPLSRLRASGQLFELRATDLRFATSEAADFLNQVMGLNLSPEDITALETRTEGWIAGLQLAAISIQGQEAPTKFIKSFTGSHRLVVDYLIEEILEHQSESIQTFLMQTAILDRFNSSLCDAITGQDNSQQTLKYLEKANLFIVPLDNERRWYRYHHLFADLLRQRLHQITASYTGGKGRGVADLHSRASVWYEKNGLAIEAFQHAAAANDVDRAERLIEGEEMPLQYLGGAAQVLNWLESLPTTELDTRASLWVMYASALVYAGQSPGAEQKLQSAEAALQDAEPDDKTQDLVGHIAALRAMMAVSQGNVETIIAHSRRALEFLYPDNLPLRTSATYTLGFAYQLQGDRAAASRAYNEVISNSQASGNFMFTLGATISLGTMQEAEYQLYLAAESYRRALQLAGDHPFNCASYLGLARIFYEWNDLDAAHQHGQQGAQLAAEVEGVDTPATCGILLARLKIAQGDVAGAVAILTEADQFVRQYNFEHQMPEVAAAQVITLLHQGDLEAAAQLAEKHDLPISQARVQLAQGETSAALAVLEPLRQQVKEKGWVNERLKVIVLLAVAFQAHGKKEKAVQVLGEALVLAEPGGVIRIFVDEGSPIEVLLRRMKVEDGNLIDPLSERELEVLRLMTAGYKYKEVAERLVISLNTVRHHTRNVYTKLNVNNRAQAIAKAKELNLM